MAIGFSCSRSNDGYGCWAGKKKKSNGNNNGCVVVETGENESYACWVLLQEAMAT